MSCQLPIKQYRKQINSKIKRDNNNNYKENVKSESLLNLIPPQRSFLQNPTEEETKIQQTAKKKKINKVSDKTQENKGPIGFHSKCLGSINQRVQGKKPK